MLNNDIVLETKEETITDGSNNPLCDLHVHSDCSDGTLTPEALVAEALRQGLQAVALCDHNTVIGLERFLAAAQGVLTAVPGVEVTAAYQGNEVHILGLFVKPQRYGQLTSYLAQINERKIASNLLLTKTLKAAGFALDYDAILADAGDAIPNRVHFARALLRKGYVSSISEAFVTLLSPDGPYYKPGEKLDAFEVIAFLASVGAVPVLAHPLVSLSDARLRAFLPRAKDCGLAAMETIYSLYSPWEAELAEQLAKAHGLLQSGGSDFHGSNKPDIQMGSGRGNIAVPLSYYEALKQLSQGCKRTPDSDCEVTEE